MSKIALAMITNDAEATITILEKYGQYFDCWYITLADKDKSQWKRLVEWSVDNKLTGDNRKMVRSFFKWEDNFGKAREFNRQQIEEPYFMWLDTDDVIENPELIPEVVRLMDANNLDAVHMLYKYMQNDLGEEIAPHWRERIVKTNHFVWADTRVHETLIAPNAATVRYHEMAILHDKTPEDHAKSMERNIQLLKQEFEETKDPRIAMYLGDNMLSLKKYDQALDYLMFLLQNGGWEEDKYRAWLRVAQIHKLTDNIAEGLMATDAAIDLLPEWPDAYYLKADLYYTQGKARQAYEWVKVATLKPVPTTMSVIDPTLYSYRGMFVGCLAAAELGKINDAWKMLQIVLQRSPNYTPALELRPIIEEAFYDAQAIEKFRWLIHYTKANNGDVPKLFAGIPSRILCDPRLNADRAALLPIKKWPKQSIVFYCGPSTEFWGPDTLSKGMGGSEEAIVYLSRELAKLDWDVTVFNDREDVYFDPVHCARIDEDGESTENGVMYLPWTLLNPYDEFDVFVAWRAPSATTNVKARVKCVDLHDTPVGHQEVTPQDIENTDFFFLKSKYQAELAATPIPEEKMVIVGNGIKAEQFNEEA
jgi:tetratricopeptide (TPR) repeat protein